MIARLTDRLDSIPLVGLDPRNPFGMVRVLDTTLPTNPWSMRVWLNNGAVNNPGTIPFNAVSDDPTNSFDTSTSIWTVPLAGNYQLNAVVAPQTPAAAQNWALQLFATTTQYFAATGSYLIQGPISSATSGGLGTTMGATINDRHRFNAGDQVYIGAFYSIAPLGVGATGGTWSFANVQEYGAYWSMQLISG